ncbi:hypothetical protein JCM10908_006787 [Rhodotorula pacifica]|uniref:uncharacterized protein n=1 Tax=Rhodotorula pacifica TaxID=1495444 RepID=UPI00317927EA
MTGYRLPLELELHILRLATPPLEMDSLHDRVDFLCKVALVYRSMTDWAQEKLHDQFLYTYKLRSDEYARLEHRLTHGGFGPTRPICRLYLDVSRLWQIGDPLPTALEAETVNQSQITPGLVPAASGTSLGSDDLEAGQGVQGGQAVFARSTLPSGACWRVEPLLARCIQELEMLWLMPPYADVDLSDISAPRYLELNDKAFNIGWNGWETLPVADKTTLVLRNAELDLMDSATICGTRKLVIDKCYTGFLNLQQRFPNLERLVCQSDMIGCRRQLDKLPTRIRHIHALHSDVVLPDPDWTTMVKAAITLPNLETFTFTWITSKTDNAQDQSAGDTDPLAKLRKAVESALKAPKCTFDFSRSTKSPQDALAAAIAALDL